MNESNPYGWPGDKRHSGPAAQRASNPGARITTGDNDAAVAALDAIIAGVNRLVRAEFSSLEARLRLIAEFDDEARAILEANLGRSASSSGRVQPAPWPLVLLGRDVFGSILDACHDSATRGECTGASALRRRECDARLIGAAAERIKWERLARGPAHLHLWRWANAALRRCGPTRGGDRPSDIAPGNAPEAAIEREYLRLVSVYSAGYDQLRPEVAAVVDGLLAFLLPTLQLHPEPGKGAVCYVDFRADGIPKRLLGPPAVADEIRFLSVAAARVSLQSFSTQLARGIIPAELSHLSGSGESLLDGVTHLLRQWSTVAPGRQHRRHTLEGEVIAVCGVEEVRVVLSGGPLPNTEAVWHFRDVSRGGIGARTPAASATQPDIGEIVALRPADGGVWHLGIVRRVWRESDEAVQVGVQTLSSAPYLARIDDGRVPADVLVCDKLQHGEAVRMVVRACQLRFGTPLYLSSHGAVHKLRALEVHPLGKGVDVWIYQVL